MSVLPLSARARLLSCVLLAAGSLWSVSAHARSVTSSVDGGVVVPYRANCMPGEGVVGAAGCRDASTGGAASVGGANNVLDQGSGDWAEPFSGVLNDRGVWVTPFEMFSGANALFDAVFSYDMPTGRYTGSLSFKQAIRGPLLVSLGGQFELDSTFPAGADAGFGSLYYLFNRLEGFVAGDTLDFTIGAYSLRGDPGLVPGCDAIDADCSGVVTFRLSEVAVFRDPAAVVAVSAPATLALSALGLGALAAVRRRRLG